MDKTNTFGPCEIIDRDESLSIKRYCNAALLALFVFVEGLSAANDLVTFTGATMGTRYSVTIPSRDDVAELQQKVDGRLREINGQMSTYDEGSELSRFNQYQGDDWFAVSTDLAQVVKFALKVAESTDGAFDPTVGPAVNLWGFGPDGRRKQPPSEAEIAAARERIGYENLEVRAEPPALKKKRPDLYLDLSAVAKGFAVDEAGDLLARAGCRDSLVVVGGEIRASGRKPDGSHWKIGIEQPDSKGQALERKVQIEDMAIGTSGDWQNSFGHDGVRYSHVIDPRTARPVIHHMAGATVLAGRAIKTDAWATALMVMGDERGIQWCDRNKVAALFFIRGPEGRISARATTYVARRIIP
jgi:FAD:protein FMN transferase